MENQKPIFKQKTSENKGLIQQLIDCAIACEACAWLCLNEEHVSMLSRCIEMNRDCADTCFHTAKLIARNSEITEATLAACEEICRNCADECRKHEMDHCQRCAETCERCSEACR